MGVEDLATVVVDVVDVVVDPVDYVEAVEEELIHQGKMVKLREGGL